MKRLIITLSVIGCLFADSPVGNWKLSGLAVDYLHITREEATVALQDAYWQASGLDAPMVVVPVSVIPSGVLYQRFTNGPFTLQTIDAAQLNLNVNIYADGTGAIADGSFYPDIDLIEGTCITSPQIFPVTDTFIWEEGAEGYQFATTNILGIPGINAAAGTPAIGLGIAESGTFDGWPSNPVVEPLPPVIDYLALTDGTVLAASCQTAILSAACGELGMAPGEECVGALMGAGAYDAVAANIGSCMQADPATAAAYFGGAGYLWGSGSSGFYKTTGLGNSQMGQTLDVDFLLEWNAIDGPNSGSGFGDELGVDEDGDGTDYDRIFGLPYIPVTYTTPECPLAPGLSLPVAGDVTGLVAPLVEGQCYEQVLGGLNDACEGAGGPVNAVTGLCAEASQTPEFAGACAYYGPAAALTATCMELGIDAETCGAAAEQALPAVDAYCVYVTGVDCATAGIDPCAVLTNIDFATGLCGTLAAALTTSETCGEWAAGFDLDEVATAELGMTCAQAGAATEAGCIAEVAYGNDMYLIDPSVGATWSYFLTMNSASAAQYMAAGCDAVCLATNYPELLVNDSGWDFDPAQHYGGGVQGGRLVMNYEPLCIPELEARQIVAEFQNLDELCSNTGDVNGDGAVNVVDVVQVVSHVLSADGTLTAEQRCEADANGDGVVNVVDIVLLVNGILSSGSNHADLEESTSASLIYSNQEIKISDDNVQGVEFTISHCEDFSIELNSEFNSSFSGVNPISDTETKVLVIADFATTGKLINDFDYIAKVNTSCDYTVSNLVFSSHNGNEMVANTEEVQTKKYSVKPSYPNPFNPTTNINLTLDLTANISVKIYNIAGQLVDVIAEGLYSPSSYKWTWNAENLASGVYFVKTQVGSDIHTEKIMLLK